MLCGRASQTIVSHSPKRMRQTVQLLCGRLT